MLLCKDKNFSNLLLLATDNTQECPKIVKAVTDIVKKITPKSPLIETVKAVLDRACPMLLDKPSFCTLLKYVKNLIDGISFTDQDDSCDEEELLGKAKTALKLVKVFM